MRSTIGWSVVWWLLVALVAPVGAMAAPDQNIQASDLVVHRWNDPPVAAQIHISADPKVWPNALSRANSDSWLVAHGDRLRQMRPRLLVLNFVNGLSPADALKKVNGLIAAIREGSRYHGYKDGKAPAFLDYQVDRIVDLTDPAGTATIDGNSTLYPRVPDWKEGINFRYSQLFAPRFDAFYGYPDPANTKRFLSLQQLVDRGIIHEVWFLALQHQAGSPYECTEVKQAYSPDFRKLPGETRQAGNGGDAGQPFIDRSLRILFINAERGPGCALESLSHALEGTAHSGAIPYFRRYFDEYASFDLDQRFGLPFNSFYGRDGAEMSYPDPHTLVVRRKDGSSITVQNYSVVGGNVHFMPSSRRDYDLDNTAPVMSTIEDYRVGSGPGHQDRARAWTNQVFKRYNRLANDCQGPWLVYWRQNMPGYNNHARDETGRPMKNWWVFLFF